jgi:O-antigen ligase
MYTAGAVAVFVAVEFIVGVVVTPDVIGVAVSSLPYVMFTLLLLAARVDNVHRALAVLAAAGAIAAVLQVASTVTGTVLIPGALRQLPFEFGPFALVRTYTYALPLFVLGFLWWLSTPPSKARRGYSVGVHSTTGIYFLAIVATGARLVYVAASVAAVSVLFVMRMRHRSRRNVVAVAVVASLVIGLVAFTAPLSQGLDEVSTGSGTWSVRANLARDVRLQLEARPVLGAGFAATKAGAVTPEVSVSLAPGSGVYGSSDSSYATLLVRFGVVGTALVLAFLTWAARTGFRLHRDERNGSLGLVLLGYIIFAVVAGIAHDSLISITSLGVIGLLIGGAVAAKGHRGSALSSGTRRDGDRR